MCKILNWLLKQEEIFIVMCQKMYIENILYTDHKWLFHVNNDGKHLEHVKTSFAFSQFMINLPMFFAL